MRRTSSIACPKGKLISFDSRKQSSLFQHHMPLTIGDTSTYYYKPRKFEPLILGREHHECGKIKNVKTSPQTKAFDKFVSAAVGDPYKDKTYTLRREESSPMRSATMLIHNKPFNSMTTPKLKYPTYDVNTLEPKGSTALSPFVDRISGFYNRKNSERF